MPCAYAYQMKETSLIPWARLASSFSGMWARIEAREELKRTILSRLVLDSTPTSWKVLHTGSLQWNQDTM